MLNWVDSLDQDLESEEGEEHDFGEHFEVPVDDNTQQRICFVVCELETSMQSSLSVSKKDMCSRGKKYMVQCSNPNYGIFADSKVNCKYNITYYN